MRPSDSKSTVIDVRYAVFLSGRGSNFRAIYEDDRLAPPALVVSSRKRAPGLEFATEAGLPTVVVRRRDWPGSAFADALIETCERAAVEWIVLAGYMVILPDEFLGRFAGRIVNIHPSLLPLFPGPHAHQQALDAGVIESGCTVHLVEPGEVDGGRILAQARVPVLDDDDADSLAARVLAEEHRLYPSTLVQLFSTDISPRR